MMLIKYDLVQELLDEIKQQQKTIEDQKNILKQKDKAIVKMTDFNLYHICVIWSLLVVLFLNIAWNH